MSCPQREGRVDDVPVSTTALATDPFVRQRPVPVFCIHHQLAATVTTGCADRRSRRRQNSP